MTFVSRQTVRFAHIDAAGIVFYPRYFEMLNAAVEDYFAQDRGVSFAEMHLGRRVGVPTVRLEASFQAPSRLGDELDFRLAFRKVGRSSADVAVAVLCGEQLRFSAEITLVCMDLDKAASLAWPDDIRPRVVERA